MNKKKVRELPEHAVVGFVETVKYKRSTSRDIDLAMGVLVKQFTPLMFKLINKYRNSRNDLRDPEDFESVARIAIVKAVQQFDPKLGFKFITFLQNGLRNELIGAYRKSVKQATVETVNEASLCVNNEDGELLIDTYSDGVDESDAYVEEHTFSEEFIYAEELVLKARLTVEEEMVYFMNNGICCQKTQQKELKKLFPDYKIHLKNAEYKVYYYTLLKSLGEIHK